MKASKRSDVISNMKSRLQSLGWEEDRFGNMKQLRKEKMFRFHFQTTSVRLETQLIFGATEYSPASKEWSGLRTAYIKDIKWDGDSFIFQNLKF